MHKAAQCLSIQLHLYPRNYYENGSGLIFCAVRSDAGPRQRPQQGLLLSRGDAHGGQGLTRCPVRRLWLERLLLLPGFYCQTKEAF